MGITRTIRQRALRVVAAGAVIAGVMLPAAALAQDDVYPTPSVPPATEPGPTPGGASAEAAPAPPSGDTLPVTGGQLAGLALIGLGVTGVGVALVRIGRRSAQTAH